MKISKKKLKEIVTRAVRKKLDEKYGTIPTPRPPQKMRTINPDNSKESGKLEIANKKKAMNSIFRFMTIQNPKRTTVKALLDYINGPMKQQFGREISMIAFDELKGRCLKIEKTAGGKEIAIWDNRCVRKTK